MTEFHDQRHDRLWIDHKTPVDDLEPVEDSHEALRDAAIKYTSIMNAYSTAMERAITAPNATVQRIASVHWQISYALGLNSCSGRSMTECARIWNLERATISKGATEFCRANDLEPSYYMKKESTQQSYRACRIAVIAASNGSNGNGANGAEQ